MFLLSKTIYLIFMPFTWVLLLMFWALLTKSDKWRKFSVRLLVLLFVIFTNPALINQAFLMWEIPPKLFKEIPENHYKIGIVLTGFSQPHKSPTDRVHFLKGADRLLHAVQLYKKKKIEKILVTGSSDFDMTGKEINPDRSLKNVFLDCGVKESDLIVESKAKTTNENAIYSAEILKQDFPNQKYVIITSAFHMRRAKACFQKQGIEAETFSTDFYSVDKTNKIVPSPKVLVHWHILFKEWMGMLAYKIFGYI